MPQGGIGYSPAAPVGQRRLGETAPADQLRSGPGRLGSGQRPVTSGNPAVYTDRPGVYSRQGPDAKNNKMPQITDQRQI